MGGRRFGDRPHPRGRAGRTGRIRIGTDVDLDIEPSRRGVTKRLAAAEMLARRDGTAVLVARPLPVTFELLKAWIMGLEDKGISLAPLTAVSARQALG